MRRSPRTRPRVRLDVQQLEPRLALTTLLPGFSEATVATGISAPTAMEFSPDGRLWVLEQGGSVKLVHSDGTTFTALTKTVDSNGERGMLGIAFDPGFTSNHFAYLYYTNPNAGGTATGVHNQLSRFTVNDTNPLQPLFTSEAPILDWNNLSGATNHNGGAIHFGADGMLYANAGDNVQTFTGPDGNTYRVSQTLANLLGKQLRIDVSKFNSGVATRDDATVGHLIPSNNPFVGTATGINQLIYVLGLRNPFTFAVQPGTGRILINDVGETTWEEIDDSIAGGNYGWSGGSTDGFGHPPPAFAAGTYHDPLLAYGHSSGSLATGSAIVGSTFYNPSTVQFPSSYVGMYFYEDLSSGWIRYFNPNTPNSPSTPDGNSHAFASNTPGGLRDLKVDSAGSLYYLSGGDGSIRKVSFTAVVGRRLFYNQSSFDGNNAAANAADNGAIATDKTAYLPGSGTTTFANVSSYARGINGIMVDISGPHGTITANDFSFKVGNNNSPNTWATAPAPTTVTVRAGAGTAGSDRVELLWASGAIQNTWLEVIVRGPDALGGSDSNTGIASSDVFFFGSAPGDSGSDDTSGFLVSSADEISARNDPHSLGNKAPITNVNDFNRDGLVNSSDQILARNFATTVSNQLKFLVVGAGGPFSPNAAPLSEAATGTSPFDSAIASAIAGASGSHPLGVSAGGPPSIDQHDASRTASAMVFGTLGSDDSGEIDTPSATGTDESAADVDDELLDALVGGL